MSNSTAFRVAASMGFLAVALGAFGAHGFKETLVRNNLLPVWETAVFYHFIHAVMLFLLPLIQPLPKGPWFAFAAGTIIFSGSLYFLALTDLRWLGAITPLGGVSFLIGWGWLIFKPPSSGRRPEE